MRVSRWLIGSNSMRSLRRRVCWVSKTNEGGQEEELAYESSANRDIRISWKRIIRILPTYLFLLFISLWVFLPDPLSLAHTRRDHKQSICLHQQNIQLHKRSLKPKKHTWSHLQQPIKSIQIYNLTYEFYTNSTKSGLKNGRTQLLFFFVTGLSE